MSVQIKCRAVVRKGSEVLLCKIKDRFRCLPWGTLEGGETTKQCLKREIFEELWIDTEIGECIYTQEIVDENITLIDFWYSIPYHKSFETINLSSTTHWFELEKIKFLDLETTTEDIKPNNLKEILSSIETETINFKY